MKLYRRVGLYYIISAITVAINLAVYGWLVYGLGINYLVAATGGFVLENVLDYVGERAFVFRMTHAATGDRLSSLPVRRYYYIGPYSRVNLPRPRPGNELHVGEDFCGDHCRRGQLHPRRKGNLRGAGLLGGTAHANTGFACQFSHHGPFKI